VNLVPCLQYILKSKNPQMIDNHKFQNKNSQSACALEL
jgi:hypothetical protein